jgi:hypothetical protein
MTTIEPVFIARTWAELLAGLNARDVALGLSMQELDELAGLDEGSSAKLLAGGRVADLGPLPALMLLPVRGVEIHFAYRRRAKRLSSYVDDKRSKIAIRRRAARC